MSQQLSYCRFQHFKGLFTIKELILIQPLFLESSETFSTRPITQYRSPKEAQHIQYFSSNKASITPPLVYDCGN